MHFSYFPLIGKVHGIKEFIPDAQINAEIILDEAMMLMMMYGRVKNVHDGRFSGS
jgi:hypothetical protein